MRRTKRTLAAAIATSTTRGLLVRHPVDQGEDAVDRQVLVVPGVVHLHCRRSTAGREALDLLQRKPPVRRLLAVRDAEPVLDGEADRIGAAERAREVPAELEMVPAR